MKRNGLFADLFRLWQCLPGKRKAQLGILFVLQVLSALSDVASLGAIVPFLSVLTDPNSLIENSIGRKIMEISGVTDPQHLAIVMAGCFAGAIVVANMLKFLTLYLQLYISALIGTDLGATLFRKTLYKPYSFFIQKNSSEFIGNMTNDFNATLGILRGVLTLVSQLLIAIAIILGLLLYNPLVSVVLGVILVCAYTVIIILLKRRLRKNSKIISDNYRSMLKTFQESLSGIGFIELTHSRDIYVNQYKETYGQFKLSSADNSVIRQAPKFFIEALGVTAISAVAIVMTSYVDDTASVIPLLGFLGLAAHRLLPAGQQIYTFFSNTLGFHVSLIRTLDVLCEPIPDTLLKPVTDPIRLQESIKLESIWFDYNKLSNRESNEWTLRDINIEIKAKTTVAFVGQTGSGKSTIADILLGLLRPNKGKIIIDDVVLDDRNMGDWQSGISYVPQRIFLTDTTIAQNIAFGIEASQIDMEQVEKVSKLAQIHDFIETLPKKYDEIVGEQGVRLSGGQMQRIGIARALYSNPSVIIFDEATSALDSNTENEVMASINRISKDITVILIAHRLSTVQNAETIFVLEDGKIVNQGNYDQLFA